MTFTSLSTRPSCAILFFCRRESLLMHIKISPSACRDIAAPVAGKTWKQVKQSEYSNICQCLAWTFADVYAVLRCFRRETSPIVSILIFSFQFPALLQAEASLCDCSKESAEVFKLSGILGLGDIFH